MEVPSRQATVQEVGTGGPLLPRAGIFLHHEEPPGVITAAAVIILDEETPLQISVTDENRKINYKYGKYGLSLLITLNMKYTFT